MESTGGNFGSVYVGVMGFMLLCGLIPVFLATLIAGTTMKIKGHQNNKRGLRIAGNILLIAAAVVVLVFAGYCGWGYYMLHR